MDYLDFEQPVKDILDQIDKVRDLEGESQVDMADKIKELEKKLEKTRRDIYKNVNAWQRVQLSRHPQRPYTLAYIEAMTKGNFIELHGDRNVKDDKAWLVAGVF
jgi:acetyl-CoA carboxylase carboxyl transferase subunit alpha